MRTPIKLLLVSLGTVTIVSCQKESLSASNFDIDVSSAKTGINTSIGLKYGNMRDIDGNTYKTIQIGSQVWMADNLRTKKYRNGNSITNIADGNSWINLTSGAWSVYNNDNNLNSSYGKLYNWYAVNDSRGLAPKGWHIPTDTELNTLLNFLGGSSIAGNKMKETGTVHWVVTSTDVTNSSGFSARGGGYRVYTGIFSDIKYGSLYWTSSLINQNGGSYGFNTSNGNVFTGESAKVQGLYVRCVKD